VFFHLSFNGRLYQSEERIASRDEQKKYILFNFGSMEELQRRRRDIEGVKHNRMMPITRTKTQPL